MRWHSYAWFALASLLLAPISMFFWMVNPATALLMFLAAPPLRSLGYHPPVGSWSGLGTAMWIGLFWPITLAPLHWLNFRVLRWGKWGYAGLLLVANVLLTMLYLVTKEGT
jgi:hypothetical protein